jgi:MFS transporter, YQGE family, putative transporter
MRRELRMLLVQSTIFTILLNYITIFINLYIYERNHSISQVAAFNLTMILFWSPSFAIAGHIFSKTSNRAVTRISSIAAAFMFLSLLFLDHVSPFLWNLCIGGSLGVMCGMYFNSQNITLSSIGKKGDDLQSFFSMNGLIGQTIGIVNPFFSAFIIKWFGYSASFVIMFLFVCILFVVTFYVPFVQLENPKKHSLFHDMDLSNGLYQFRWLFVSSIVGGLVIQFQGLFNQLFTFDISDNKLIIAALNVSYTVLTAIALWVSKRVSIPGETWMRIGGFVFIVGCLMVLHPTKLFLLIANTLTVLGYFFYMITWNTQQFSFMGRFAFVSVSRVMVGREITINFGRGLMLVFMIPIHHFQGFIYMFVILFSVFCVVILYKIQAKMLQTDMLPIQTKQHVQTVKM